MPKDPKRGLAGKPRGKWRTFLESLVEKPGVWGRTPWPMFNHDSAKQYASNIRNNIALARPVRHQDGTDIKPEDGEFEAEFRPGKGEDIGKFFVYARWVPVEKPVITRKRVEKK